MALNKILSSMVEDFCEKNTFRDLSPSKAYDSCTNEQWRIIAQISASCKFCLSTGYRRPSDGPAGD